MPVAWDSLGSLLPNDIVERSTKSAMSAISTFTSSLAKEPEAGSSTDNVRRLPAAGTVPSPRESHSITAIGHHLYVFGGFDGARVLNDLYYFDTHAGLWSQLVHTGISPAARAGHSATALGMPAHLVVFGGANSSRRFGDVQLFDTSDNHWQKPAVRGKPPSARYYHCACLARGSLLVLGGNDGTACLADLHALNTESWAWSQPLTNGQPPSPRCGATGTLVNKLLFVVGGAADSAELGDLHILDTESWSWWKPQLSSPLPPIAYHAAALTADKIFVFGGSTREALYNDVLMIDTSTCGWRVVQSGDAAKLPRRRRLGAARGSGTRVLFFGGWDGSHTCADLLEMDTSPWLQLERQAARTASSDVKAKRAGAGAVSGSSGGGGGERGGLLSAVTVAAPDGAAAGRRSGSGGVDGVGQYAVLPGGGGFGSSGGGSSSGNVEVAMERMESRHEEELQRMRGEVARLRMSNELMSRELSKLKTIVGAAMPGEHGGMDIDSLATRKEVEGLKMEMARMRRLHAQEREGDQAAAHAEMDSLKRMLHALSLRISDVAEAAAHAP
jgi:N-acetylneuraminic acid mutarotase